MGEFVLHIHSRHEIRLYQIEKLFNRQKMKKYGSVGRLEIYRKKYILKENVFNAQDSYFSKVKGKYIFFGNRKKNTVGRAQLINLASPNAIIFCCWAFTILHDMLPEHGRHEQRQCLVQNNERRALLLDLLLNAWAHFLSELSNLGVKENSQKSKGRRIAAHFSEFLYLSFGFSFPCPDPYHTHPPATPYRHAPAKGSIHTFYHLSSFSRRSVRGWQ